MDAEKFLKDWQRMCDSYGDSCKECPLFDGVNVLCWVKVLNKPDRAIECVAQWSKEHLLKTRLDDFKEKFPNYKFLDDTTPPEYPSAYGYCGDVKSNHRCHDCPNVYKPLRWCWDQPMEG